MQVTTPESSPVQIRQVDNPTPIPPNDDPTALEQAERRRLMYERIAQGSALANVEADARRLPRSRIVLADQQLELSRERYRLGALSYIDLSESTTLKARADRAYLASVYAFHQALAALEAAVGRPLTSSLPEIE